MNKQFPVGRCLARLGVACAGFAASVACAANIFEFPTPVTPVAEDTLRVHNIFLAIITAIFAASAAVLVYSLIAHRKSRGHRPARFTGLTGRKQWLMAIGIFVGFAFIDYVILGIPAWHAILAMADTKSDATMILKVTGSQWKWMYEYPDQDIRFLSSMSTPQDQIANKAPKDANYLLDVDNPVVLPVGRKIRILLTSTDVIHSWGMPAFGVKQDAVPGFLRETWVKIEKPGVYRGQCGELCGVGHAFMPIVVQAVNEPEFQQWVAQKQAETAAARVADAAAAGKSFTREELLTKGKTVYDSACAACHQADGAGVPGTFPPLAAGRPFSATPQQNAALRERGFLTEDGKVVMGPVPNHVDIVLKGIAGTAMPPFAAQLSDSDVAAVISYERNSFGNHTGDLVQPADVSARRVAR